MRSTYQDELLSKKETKYGRNNCLLDIPDKLKTGSSGCFLSITEHFCLAAHLYCIGIFSAACPCVTKEMSLWTNTTCGPVELSTEIRNHRDIGRRDDFGGDNLRLSSHWK
ncbi:hypothetical protein NPIL_259731 [Nephila pilipes]|uniref:Uncharacterized protein n=1 Tax=Nephila pilipes TaxID=299642 RepID=A0A8X6QU66_NEPPI|nr:hypothetical protein NPIL_259731 [Nephila pilipes]